jgi:ketosteroid isomerase-like protein
MALVIDPNRTWAKVEERLASETDPVLRRNLETVLEHMKAEAVGDIDGLLETLSDDVAYHAYGTDEALMNPVGKDGVRAFYEAFIASGATRLQLEIDRLVVDRDCVLTEGVMRMAYPGTTLAARGIAVDDPDAYYLYEARMATLWPMDETGKARGEDTYTGSDGFAGIENRKLRPEGIGALSAVS